VIFLEVFVEMLGSDILVADRFIVLMGVDVLLWVGDAPVVALAAVPVELLSPHMNNCIYDEYNERKLTINRRCVLPGTAASSP
jgi:hypothetical protein